MTAVLAIDQLHRMLRAVGKRELRTDELLGDFGHLRAIVRTPKWDDFVHLSLSEIRNCGTSNLQIVRRRSAQPRCAECNAAGAFEFAVVQEPRRCMMTCR